MGPLELADFIGLDVCLVDHARARTRASAVRSSRRRGCSSTWSTAGHLGQKTGRGFYAYPRSRDDRCRSGRSADRRGTTAPVDHARLRPSRGRTWCCRAGRDRALRPCAVPPDGRAGTDGGAVRDGGRRRGVQLPRVDAGHGRDRLRRHGHGGVAERPHPLAVPGHHLGQRRAEAALAAGDAGRREARRIRADRAPGGIRRERTVASRRASRADRRSPCLSPDRYQVWITNAIEAERYLVFGTVDPAAGSRASPRSSSKRARPGSASGGASESSASAPTPPPS